MRTRTVIGAVSFAACAIGCGAVTDDRSAGPDAPGESDGPRDDPSHADAFVDDANDERDASTTDAPVEVGPGPNAVLLKQGSLQLHGITADGFVVYSDATTVYATSLEGRAEAIATFAPTDDTVHRWKRVRVIDATVFVLRGYEIVVWSHARKATSLTTTGAWMGGYGIDYGPRWNVDVSIDGSIVMYNTHVTDASRDVAIATLDASGAHERVLVAGGGGRFVGNIALAGTQHDLAWFDPVTFAKTTISTGVTFSARRDGTTIVQYDFPTLRAIPLAAAPAKIVDRDASGAMTQPTRDERHVVYMVSNAESRTLRLGSLVGDPPVTLVPYGPSNGLGLNVFGFSPDERYVLVDVDIPRSGLLIVSTSKVNEPRFVDSASTNPQPSFTFTADSRYLVFVGNSPNYWNLELVATQVEGASSQRVLGAKTAGLRPHALDGSELLFADDIVSTPPDQVTTANLEWVDLAKAEPPRRIASGIGVVRLYDIDNYFIDAGNAHVIFMWTGPSDASTGIYVAPIH